MPRKVVLVAGASGLVGYAAMKHFAGDAACEVIAVSRRRPDETSVLGLSLLILLMRVLFRNIQQPPERDACHLRRSL